MSRTVRNRNENHPRHVKRIEFEEGNYDVSLELIQRALNVSIEEYDYEKKIADIEDKIKKLNQKKIIFIQ